MGVNADSNGSKITDAGGNPAERQTFEAMIVVRLLITFLRLNLAQSHVVTRNIIHKATLQIYLHFPRVPEEFCTSLLVPRLPYFQAILSRTSNENWGITSEKMTSLLTEANVTHSKKAHMKDTAQYFDKFIVLLILFTLLYIDQ